jgi:hypothetical protein
MGGRNRVLGASGVKWRTAAITTATASASGASIALTSALERNVLQNSGVSGF